MSLRPVMIEVSGDPSPRRAVRVRTSHNGHEHDRKLADLCPTGIEILHRQTDQRIVYRWSQLLQDGGALFGVSPEQFAAYLLEIAKYPTSPGPSASDPGDVHGPDSLH